MKTRDIMTGLAASKPRDTRRAEADLQTVQPGETLARDIMRGASVLQTVRPNETLADAARKMREHKVSALPVMGEDRRVVGMISERDLTAKYEQESKAQGLRTLQASFVAWVTPESSVDDVGRLIQDLSAAGRMSVEKAMTTDIVIVDEEDSVGTLLQRMAERNVNHVPVVSGDRLTGIVARQDVLSALSGLAEGTPEII